MKKREKKGKGKQNKGNCWQQRDYNFVENILIFGKLFKLKWECFQFEETISVGAASLRSYTEYTSHPLLYKLVQS